MYDVAILGTGLGGGTLGAILARHHIKVLMVEDATHPRFAIGESTVPETNILLRVLAERYDVPEVGHLSSYSKVLRHVGTSCGVKRNFSFFYHRPGMAQKPSETTQLNTAAPPIGPDVHFFRQDVDAYMMTVAVQYGAHIVQRVRVTTVDFVEDGVALTCQDGRVFRARFVVDAGGVRSLFAQKFCPRLEPCPLLSRSRSIYTHMIGVRPYDECSGRNLDLVSSPSQGTLHHLFEGGWMWVIPFNNHPESTNRLVSVGLNLDIDIYPRNGLSPESEFQRFVALYPTIAKQFERAVPIREWTATDRLQFLSSTAVGQRFCLLPHAFGFVDPLFSSGLSLTMHAVNAIASRLILAAKDENYSRARFDYVDHWTQANIKHFDRLVSGSYLSFQCFEMWNAWTRVWMIGGFLGAFVAYELLQRAKCSEGPLSDPVFESFPYRGTQGSEISEYAALLDVAENEWAKVRSGDLAGSEASCRVFQHIERSRLWPTCWGRLDPVYPRHAGTFNLFGLYRNSCWLRREAPRGVRDHLYVVPSTLDAIGYAGVDIWEAISQAISSCHRSLRDYIFDYNCDWKLVREPKNNSSAIKRQGAASAPNSAACQKPLPAESKKGNA